VSNYATYRRRGGGPPPIVVVADVTVISVVAIDAIAEWTFSTTIASIVGLLPQLEVYTGYGGGGFLSPVAILQSGPASLYASYIDDPVLAEPYRVLTDPSGITFGNGHTLAVPALGIIT
jgi:hypothetical protein